MTDSMCESIIEQAKFYFEFSQGKLSTIHCVLIAWKLIDRFYPMNVLELETLIVQFEVSIKRCKDKVQNN